MGSDQTVPGSAQTVVPPVTPQPQVPQEAKEIAEVVTDLVQKTSELVMACEEINEDMIRIFPPLKEVKELCLDTARTMRTFMKLTRRKSR